ncbi:MAG: hypothetical protein JO279_12145 [Verrucomicrobia bacterium]|nr:hypothetical protein [Verrucomicrobiota bacterium]
MFSVTPLYIRSQVQAGQEDNIYRPLTISLLKGGGTIPGIGEKFPVTRSRELDQSLFRFLLRPGR